MIIVTGTKRSGTSMWMQILKAAGYAIIGEPFPRDWAETIRAGNRLGFYESPLRRGIYDATNPDPRSGEYLCPRATQRVGVKVFVPGLLRTEGRFVHKVIATMRPWREYERSVERLYSMEHANRKALRRARGQAPSRRRTPSLVTPVLAWWNENYRLLRDARLRGYPMHLVSYARVLDEPYRSVEQALAFLGAGDVARAALQVQRQLRTQYADQASEPSVELDRATLRVLDELYARVHEGARLEPSFWACLERTHARLLPLIREDRARVRAQREPERAALRPRAVRACP